MSRSEALARMNPPAGVAASTVVRQAVQHPVVLVVAVGRPMFGRHRALPACLFPTLDLL